MAYLTAPIDTDYRRLLRRALQRIAEQYPGWRPSSGHLEVALLQEMVRIAQSTAEVAAIVPDRIFEAFGEDLIGVEREEAERATSTVTFTMIDDDGYAIPSGTIVGWDDGSGDLVLFRTSESAVALAGTTTASAPVEAVEEGERANGAGPGSGVPVDALRAVAAVDFDEEAAGGRDAETASGYRDRLADELQLQAPRPILPDDFAVFARRVDGVQRAYAIDGYDPGPDTDGNDRTVTVALVDADGKPVPASVADDVVDLLEANRELNFVVHTLDPTYTAVDVDVTVVAEPGRDLGSVEDRIADLVVDELSPARFSGGDRSPPEWGGADTVRYTRLIGLIATLDGVAFVSDLTLNGDADDLALAGRAPLPAPFEDPDSGDPWSAASTVTVTVTASD